MSLIVGMINGGCGEKSASNSATATQRSSIPTGKIDDALLAAQQYMATNDLTKAQAILVRLIDQAPGEVRAYELYGQVLALMAIESESRGKFQSAKTHRRQAYENYKVATKLDPDSPGLHHSAGIMATTASRNDEALEHFQKARSLDETNAQYPLFEAQVLIQQKRFDDAKESLAHVLKLDPDEAFAHASLAMIALNNDDFENALSHIRNARSINPQSIEFRAQEARIHRRAGDPSRAIELLVGIIDVQHVSEIVTYELAESYAELGQFKNAAEAWQRFYLARSHDPNSWKPAVRVGEYMLRAGERGEAQTWLDRAKLIAPHATEVKALESRLER